jgi:carboxypeptidase C (cathepsin A)
VALPWSGGAAFAAAADAPWTYPGDAAPAGLARSYQAAGSAGGRFTFLQVYAAGHLVPMDQPQAALHMLNTFLFEQPF